MRPFAVSPTPWPARPMRCSPRDTDFGDSTCTTRSTAPMSMPSSSEPVATSAGSSPGLELLLDRVRSSRASEPWWARAISSYGASSADRRRASSLSRGASALGEAAVVDEDHRRAMLRRPRASSSSIDRRPDRRRAARCRDRLERVASSGSSRVRSSTRRGTSDRQVERACAAPSRRSGLPPRAAQEPRRPRPAGDGSQTGRCAGGRRLALDRGEPLELSARCDAALGPAPARGSRRRSPCRR